MRRACQCLDHADLGNAIEVQIPVIQDTNNEQHGQKNRWVRRLDEFFN